MFVLSLPPRFPLRFLIALALGALHAAAFIDDAAWPIAIAALAGMATLAARAARDTTSWRAAFAGARAGLAFGLGWLLTGISWIYISLHTYGEMPAPLAAMGTFLLAAYLALYPALACAAFAALRRRFAPQAAASSIASIAAFSALWALSEIGRGFIFTGFPWLASGYAQVGGPLAGYAPWLGVYGVSFAAALVAATLAAAAGGMGRGEHPRAWVALLLIVGVPLAGGRLARIEWSEPSGAPISVRLLQGNIAQDVKFVAARFDATAELYLKLIEARPADLIVLPETAFPKFLSDLLKFDTLRRETA